MAAFQEVVVSAARELVAFINKSPSPYHAVDQCRVRLLASGFQELKESDHWDIKPASKYFVTRNQSTLIAFAVGGQFKPGNGFSLIGAHTDSPCLKVKPISRRVKYGYIQVGVETYGGGTWHTWFDRDLKVAGRVMVKNGTSLEHHLVDVNRPILRLPNLAIHLNREMGQQFTFNKETHFAPVLATAATEELQYGTKSSDSTDIKVQSDKHHSVLVKVLSEELKTQPENILDFELCLADCNEATIGGALNEFIFAPRLDNLISSFCAMEGLIASCGTGGKLSEDPNIRLITLFDNEEVGSNSAQGAASTLLEIILRRLSAGGSSTAFEEAVPKSLMVSCDVAHAVHPNYSEKHDEQHRPAFHKGIVIKFNANQRYATTAITSTMLRAVAERAKVPLQDFVIRQDMACGSTIGPITAAKLGMPTIDIGAPLLSMHSIREMCDISSVHQSTQLFKTFFETYPEIFTSTKV
jgi:aspartyl aminopeptidase